MKLDEHLSETGETFYSFAKRAGVNRSIVGRIVRGLRKPGMVTMMKIRKASSGAVTEVDYYPDDG